MHNPIKIEALGLSFPHKTCFQNFDCEIICGSRIAIIGRNGNGKSTLLKIIVGAFESYSGTIDIGPEVVFGYVPQIIDDCSSLSGGQRLNKAVTEALNLKPNVLLLDEPTNHLDIANRKSLMRMLKYYPGTLIIVSHDTELLRNCIDTLWHIDNQRINIFSGNYDDYIREVKLKRESIKNDLDNLNREKKVCMMNLHKNKTALHRNTAVEKLNKALHKIQLKAKEISNKNKIPGSISQSHEDEHKISGRKVSIDKRKQELNETLEDLRPPEVIIPKFSISSHDVVEHTVVKITKGAVGYLPNEWILSGIELMVFGGTRVALLGDNGSGKSTLIKAILGNKTVRRAGNWFCVSKEEIGYLDQHYSTLDPNKSVVETISALAPHWSYTEVRKHLSDFLFRKKEEIEALVGRLSGGEKARLTLAQIAAKTPKLLILDEITNNLDLETKEYVVQVLKAYPGTMIVISHENDFLKEIGVESYYQIKDSKVKSGHYD